TAVARMLTPPLMVTLTQGGFTARKVAALRAPVPILAVTTQTSTFRHLALVWGVTPVLVDRVPGYDAMLEVVRDLILKRGYAARGDRIVMTAGGPWEGCGSTNLIKVEEVRSAARPPPHPDGVRRPPDGVFLRHPRLAP